MEDAILWCVYAGALEAKKQRRFAHITRTFVWQKNLAAVRMSLAGIGLVL